MPLLPLPSGSDGSLNVDLIDLQTHLGPQPQVQCMESSGGRAAGCTFQLLCSLATCSDGFLKLSVPQLSIEWDLIPYLIRV